MIKIQLNLDKTISSNLFVLNFDRCTINRAPSMYTVPTRSDSPRSVRSAPWPAPKSSYDKKYPNVPSPKSVRSAGVGCSNRERDKDRHHRSRKRSASAESNSSCDSRSHRR